MYIHLYVHTIPFISVCTLMAILRSDGFLFPVSVVPALFGGASVSKIISSAASADPRNVLLESPTMI